MIALGSVDRLLSFMTGDSWPEDLNVARREWRALYRSLEASEADEFWRRWIDGGHWFPRVELRNQDISESTARTVLGMALGMDDVSRMGNYVEAATEVLGKEEALDIILESSANPQAKANALYWWGTGDPPSPPQWERLKQFAVETRKDALVLPRWLSVALDSES